MNPSTAQGAPRRPSRGERREPVSRLRRAAQVVLVLGSVLAVAATFGPVWVVRVGVGVAVVTSIVCCTLAWRETFGERRTHARTMQRTHREHGATLRAERTRNAEVVDTLTERLRSTGMVVAGQRGTINQLRGEVGVLRAERDQLQEQVHDRDGLIAIFASSLREQETALLVVREDERTVPAGVEEVGGDAEVHALPRRSRPADDPEPVLDATMVELAMVLPNYEGDRRVG